MGNGQHSALIKFGLDYFLNELIVFEIDISRGLINENYMIIFQESSTNAKKLFLSS
jgi:hypothetical protein